MKLVGPLLVLAAVVAGFAYYTLFTGPTIPTAPDRSAVPGASADSLPVPPANDPNERQSSAGTDSIMSLYTDGQALECAITYIPNPVESEITGTIFTFAGQLRGDFVVPSPDLTGQIVTSVIIDDTTIWQWTDIDGQVIGSQQPLTSDESVLQRLVAPIGLTQDVQYNCLTWPNIDRTVFNPPPTVLFTEATTVQPETGTIYLEEAGEF